MEHHTVISSTQEVAHEWAKQGAPEGAVVFAEEQEGGRGRAGNRWHSPPGAGIWMSLVLRPKIAIRDAPHFTLLTALAVKNGLFASGVDCPITIKWPNDLLIHGKKVCGILAELRSHKQKIAYMVIGIGINVNTSLSGWPPELRTSTTSLSLEMGRAVSRSLVVANILHEIEKESMAYFKDGFLPLKDKWEANSLLLSKKITTRTPHGLCAGVVQGLNERGELIMQTREGKKILHTPCIELVE